MYHSSMLSKRFVLWRHPWHTLLCVPLGQCVCGSVGTEEVMFASWPAPNTALPRQKMLWWEADHRGGGVQMPEWSHQQPTLVQAGHSHHRKATSFYCFIKKSLFSLYTLLIIRILLKLLSCLEFVWTRWRKEKGGKPARQSLVFSKNSSKLPL